jgi:hypothetical protein
VSVILAHASERWEAADGAPQGPSFDFVIPSSRRAQGSYRIARDAYTGVLVHSPRCLAWVHGGPTLCTHVKQAVARAEHPAAEFLAQVRETLGSSTYWANPEEAMRVLGVVKRAMEEAEAQIAANERGAAARAESEAFRAMLPEEQEAVAVAEFGERPGGRS